MVDTMARERGGLSFVPDGRLLQDNGAMIAWTGIIMHKAGVRMAVKDTVIDQRFRTDDVEVSWR
jgi:tRNA A37 threonylcarbamoyltransferase TsaD